VLSLLNPYASLIDVFLERMRAVIQRVIRASVRVGDDLISSIERGLCVLVGITHEDDQSDIDYLVKKLLAIRLWPSTDGTRNWTRNVVELDGSLLCVSQFTLHATLKGTKPDFHLSMSGEQSKILYEKFLLQLKEHYRAEKICDGQFGALMNVQIGKWKQLSLEAANSIEEEN
jgi:D-aminoacyl-tRNA deacylase